MGAEGAYIYANGEGFAIPAVKTKVVGHDRGRLDSSTQAFFPDFFEVHRSQNAQGEA